MNPGIYFDLPADEYHASDAISKSGLDRIARSPAHFQAWRNGPREETPALKIGTAAHTAVLEQDDFWSRYAAIPKIDRRTKEGKAQLAGYQAANAGKILLDADEFAQLDAMGSAVRAHKSAGLLLRQGRAEVSIFRDIDGLDAKCRIDWVNERAGILVDLKTTEDASPKSFERSIFNYRYHAQAAFYLDAYNAATGAGMSDFLFIAVEKSPPYAVAVYAMDRDVIEMGRNAYRRDMGVYRWCLENNQWPGYPDDVQTIGLPAWAMKGETA